MTSRRRIVLIAGTVTGSVLVFLSLSLLLVPDRVLKDLAVRAARQQGYELRADRFGKAFPLGIRGSGLILSGDRGPLLKADKASVRLGILPLFTGRIVLSYRAAIGPGEIHGEFSPRNNEFTVEARGVRLEDIPFFASVTGAGVAGELSVASRFREKGKNPGGELRVEVKKARLTGVKLSGLPLPEVENGTIQGMIRQKDGALRLESFTLLVDGLYVRLKGDLPVSNPISTAPLNLTLELMPKPEFLDKQKFIFLVLIKYLVSPGNYRIPIGGTLAQPLPQ